MRGASLLLSALACACACGAANGPLGGTAEIAFSRILHGWTNYSTAFNATHDTAATGDYATVAAFFVPAADVTPVDYAAIVISSGTRPPDFSRFRFLVMAWSSLDAFIQEPRRGDVATWEFNAPTGGSTATPDATTRGGRPAYQVRFSLTNSVVTLTNGHSYLIGVAALADTQTAGELFVPTSSQDGPSDVQAGDLVVGGWRYLVNAGGSTVYSGELAVELLVAIPPPRMEIVSLGSAVLLSWPVAARDFTLEYAFNLTVSAQWLPVDAEPFEQDGRIEVLLPIEFTRQFFRLRR
jgi:hypothetical protein